MLQQGFAVSLNQRRYPALPVSVLMVGDDRGNAPGGRRLGLGAEVLKELCVVGAPSGAEVHMRIDESRQQETPGSVDGRVGARQPPAVANEPDHSVF